MSLKFNINNKILKFFFLITFIFINNNVIEGCDLVLHDWQLRYYYKLPIDFSIIPLSEISILEKHFQTAVTDKIVWISKSQNFEPFINILFSYLDGWVSKTKWYIVPNNKALNNLLKEFGRDNKKPIIVGSDKNNLKICLFSDANSNHFCYQLVIAVDNRIRCIFQDSKNPWAQEFKGQSCFSIVFYNQIRLDSIISINVYPIKDEYKTIYDNTSYVEELLNNKKLKARSNFYFNPNAKVIPDLPD